MAIRSTDARWGAIARSLHWIIFVLIVIAATVGLIMVELPKRPNIIPVYSFHKSIGLTVLALAVLRLVWRLFDRRPREPAMPAWQHWASRLVHGALYVLIFAIPLSGWLFDSAGGLRPLHWFGLFEVPKLLAPNGDVKDVAETLHEALFWVLAAAVVLHVGGALKHHFVDRDDVLARMLPWRTRRLRAAAAAEPPAPPPSTPAATS